MHRTLLALALFWACDAPACALELGTASYYGGRHHGKAMANGQAFDQMGNSCAHKTHRFGTVLRVTDMRGGRSVICVVRDRGPFIKGRIVDLSVAGAVALGIKGRGIAPVTVEVMR